MVDVRVVRMRVLQWQVRVSVAVFAAAAMLYAVRVLVVLVMFVFVLVFQRFVLMLMAVVFREVQPHPQAHQRSGHPKNPRALAPRTPTRTQPPP